MKKLPLALAIGVIAASSSLNAATVYDNKGLKFKIDGDIQIQLRQRVGDDEELHVDYDDSELKFKLGYDIGNNYTAFAESHFDTGKDRDGAVEAEETFVGIKNDAFKVQIGRMDYVTDEFATEKGIEEPLAESAFEAGEVDGDDVILIEAKAGPVNIALSHDLGGRNETDADEFSSTDLYITGKFGPVKAGFAYQDLEEDENTQSETVGVNLKAKLGPVSLAGDYSEKEFDDTPANDFEVINLSAGFKVAPTTKTHIGYQSLSPEEGEDVDGWYANVVYKFPKAKKVSVFAELQDTDEDDTDVGYLVGMRVKF